MEYTAKWGPKGFVVSPTKIVPFDDFSASYSYDAEKGADPVKVALSTTYIKAAGVDPRAQVEEWTSQIGKKYPLYIEGKRFGPLLLVLTKVDVSDLLVSNSGAFLRVTVTIALEEYSYSTTSSTTTSSTTTSSNTGTTYTTTNQNTTNTNTDKNGFTLIGTGTSVPINSSNKTSKWPPSQDLVVGTRGQKNGKNYANDVANATVKTVEKGLLVLGTWLGGSTAKKTPAKKQAVKIEVD